MVTRRILGGALEDYRPSLSRDADSPSKLFEVGEIESGASPFWGGGHIQFRTYGWGKWLNPQPPFEPRVFTEKL